MFTPIYTDIDEYTASQPHEHTIIGQRFSGLVPQPQAMKVFRSSPSFSQADL